MEELVARIQLLERKLKECEDKIKRYEEHLIVCDCGTILENGDECECINCDKDKCINCIAYYCWNCNRSMCKNCQNEDGLFISDDLCTMCNTR